ncbi:hypothetical protein FGG08_000696 [Glutinoglossum americanum]|uniref:Uncharacterized protein n=1 Tax=Glutinoglossum americanum TaxID=1670608 RepID=A0A9P8IG46_9PEZI|nr:hypothetical protein FGG08_000696 [Glutinoglossum americanum]
MNRSSSPFAISYTHSPNPFQPAVQYLRTASGWHLRPDTNGPPDDPEAPSTASDMNRQRSSTPEVGSVPLINFSPSPSPYSRKSPSLPHSDDEEDDDFDHISAGRPLVPFPYPLTTTLFELLITHVLLLWSASLTRSLEKPLTSLGLACVIAPSHPLSSSNMPAGFRASGKAPSGGVRFIRWFVDGSGGIAGGGILELEWSVARQVLLLAAVYIGKVVLSNLSYAYAPLEMYTVARIGVVPISFFLNAYLTRTSHSISTLSSAITATLNILIASIRPGSSVAWESVVAGVFSSLFVALYPILLLRTYRNLVAMQNPQIDDFASFNGPISVIDIGCSKEETRAGWRTLHYTSLLSIFVLLPIVLFSGEIGNISRNCYFLDVPFFWFLTLCGGIGSWSVFFSTLLFTKATSPLTTAIGGAVWHGVKGFRNSPYGERRIGAITAIKARAPVLGGNFGVWGGLFGTFDCAVKGIRKKEDPYNAIIAGFFTGGALAVRGGLKAARNSAIGCACLLAVIEGVGIGFQRMMAENTRLDVPQPPPPPPSSGDTLALT